MLWLSRRGQERGEMVKVIITDTRVQCRLIACPTELRDPRAPRPSIVTIIIVDEAKVPHRINVSINRVTHHIADNYMTFSGMIIDGGSIFMGSVDGRIDCNKLTNSTVTLNRIR